ncbi:MAG: hypothetical protein AB1505_27030 [Candidatus Latescibacterota bacterium]
MARLCTILGTVVAVAVAVPSPATQAQAGAYALWIYEILPEEAPDLHDGSLEDWQRLGFGPTLTETEFEELPPTDEGRIGPPDVSFDIYLGWMADPPRLYMGIELRDDEWQLYEGDQVPLIEGKDRLVIGIDADATGDYTWEEMTASGCRDEEWDPERQRWYCASDERQAQFWEFVLRVALEPRLYHGLREWTTALPWSDAGGSPGPKGDTLVMEGWVTPFDQCYYEGPERSVVSTLSAGQTVLLYAGGKDYDRVQADVPIHMQGLWYNVQIGPSSGAHPWNSDRWPAAVLMPASARPTAVPTAAWGRLKRGGGKQ